MHSRRCAARSGASGTATRRYRRRGRNRNRAGGGTPSDHARGCRLWPRPRRSRKRYSHHSDRGRRSNLARPPRISDATTRLLKSLHVDVRTNSKVTEVREDGVQLADGGFIPSELVIWCAGVKGPDVLSRLDGLETNGIGQLVVTPTLQTTRDPDIFAIGD